MEQAIRERFNDTILHKAARLYGVEPADINSLGGFESYIYEFNRGGADYILRIAHSVRRTEDMIQGEVDWINYLDAGGAGVAKAVLSDAGKLVEAIEDGADGRFLTTAFVKANGVPPLQKERWNETLWVAYGRSLGKIHALSKSYTPAKPEWKRPSWDDPVNRLENWLPPEEKAARRRLLKIIAHIQTLPQDHDSYGMIHQDAHGGNFFVDDACHITFFDFDDCVYGHYIYDIAMVLFYAITNRPDAEEFAPVFMKHFMRGYRKENNLDALWLLEIPHFLKYREIDLYAAIFRSVDMENTPPESWIGQFMNGRKQRIEAGTPYLDIDYGRL